MTSQEPGSTDDLAELRRRLAVLEDKEAIVGLITRYGIFADLGDSEGAASCYTTDAVVDTGTDEAGNKQIFYGRDGVRQIIEGDGHQANLPRCAHTGGPFEVVVEGDRATAVGYYRTYVVGVSGNELWRLAFTRLELRRVDGSWLIARRISRKVGGQAAQDVLRGMVASGR